MPEESSTIMRWSWMGSCVGGGVGLLGSWHYGLKSALVDGELKGSGGRD